jgi:hypothetical protein
MTTSFAFVSLVAASLRNPVAAMSAFAELKALWSLDLLKGLLAFLFSPKGLHKLLERKTRMELDGIHPHGTS